MPKCGACGEEGHIKTSKKCPKHEYNTNPHPNIDRLLKKSNLTEEECLLARAYYKELIDEDVGHRKHQLEIGKKYGKTPRSQGMCQEASQGIIRQVFNNVLKDKTCRNPDSGDLVSDTKGKIECKVKTCKNNAPGSCGGKQGWDTFVFGDFSKYLEDRYKIMMIQIPDTDPKWDQFKPANKDISKKLIRPRLNWNEVLLAFKDDIEVIYEGSFDGIFT
jgi:hypothetical protein